VLDNPKGGKGRGKEERLKGKGKSKEQIKPSRSAVSARLSFYKIGDGGVKI